MSPITRRFKDQGNQWFKDLKSPKIKIKRSIYQSLPDMVEFFFNHFELKKKTKQNKTKFSSRKKHSNNRESLFLSRIWKMYFFFLISRLKHWQQLIMLVYKRRSKHKPINIGQILLYTKCHPIVYVNHTNELSTLMRTTRTHPSPLCARVL